MEIKLDSNQQREFKKWVNDSFVFGGPELTNFCNINNENQLKKNILEIDIFLNHKKEQLEKVEEYLIKYSTFPEKLVPKLISYIKSINNIWGNPKNNDVEYKITKILWSIIEELKEKEIKNFNEWIILLNRIHIEPQKGYKND